MTVISENLLNLDKLKNWMDTKHLSGGEIEDIELLAGGTQNILVKFTRGGRTYVLRRPPEHPRKKSNEIMRREARVLAAIAGSTVPHPELIAACPEEDVLGFSFYLMAAVDGFNPANGLKDYHLEKDSRRVRMSQSMVEGISELSKIDYRQKGLGDFGNPEGYLERQVSRWQHQLDTYSSLEGYPGPDIPGLKETAGWLNEKMPADYRTGIIHGDYHLANVMFENDSPELAAIVDWELCTIGDPLVDLGWLMATWPDRDGLTVTGFYLAPGHPFPGTDELVAHYGRINDRDLTHINWYAVFACYKLGIILEGTHARAFSGQAPKEVGDMLHATTVALFKQALAWID